jgi:hypothetical protein
MKHTSINLTEEHLRLIEVTGESPSVVIRTALEAYFNPEPSVLELIREHERLFHMPDNAHLLRIPSDMRTIAHNSSIEEPITSEAPQLNPPDMPDNAHNSRIDENMRKNDQDSSMRTKEHNLSIEDKSQGMLQNVHTLPIDERKLSMEATPQAMPENAHNLRIGERVRTIAHNPGMTPEQAQILRLILQDMEAGKEPTPEGIGQALGLEARKVGTLLSPLGIKSTSTRREGKGVRLYSQKLRPRLEELLQEPGS